MLSNKRILGILLMVVGIILFILKIPLFFGIAMLIFGAIIFLNKREDEIEENKAKEIDSI